MKTSLKRSEIIEQLKRFFPGEKSFTIKLESIVVESEFSIYYFLLFRRELGFQTLNIHLNYGWIEYEICNMYGDYDVAYSQYFREMRATLEILDDKHDKLPF